MKQLDPVNQWLKDHDVSSARGAPMGRFISDPSYLSVVAKPQEVKNILVAKVRFTDGDYDLGGAYWGRSRRQGAVLYGILLDNGDDPVVFTSLRCVNNHHCLSLMQGNYPNASIENHCTGRSALISVNWKLWFSARFDPWESRRSLMEYISAARRDRWFDLPPEDAHIHSTNPCYGGAFVEFGLHKQGLSYRQIMYHLYDEISNGRDADGKKARAFYHMLQHGETCFHQLGGWYSWYKQRKNTGSSLSTGKR